jgi:hypothetical protein
MSLKPLLLTAALLMPAGLAAAEPYTLLVFESATERAKRLDTGEVGTTYWAGYAAFAAEAQSAGILRGGAVLHTDEKTLSLSVEDGNPKRAEAMDASAPLKLGGFFKIDVASEDEALAWAAKLPAARSGRIEIRADYPAPQM